MLTTFKDLIIEGQDLKKFITKFYKYVDKTFTEAWKIEEHDDVFFISNHEEKATVCLVYKDYEIKNKIEVTNVIPTDEHALTVDRYNIVLENFTEQILKKFISKEQLDLNIILSDGKISLNEIFGERALDSLNEYFSAISSLNLSELKEITTSISQWYDFILFSYNDGNMCYNKEELKEYFAEMLQDAEKAEFLATEYERMITLLSYYDETFKNENRG